MARRREDGWMTPRFVGGLGGAGELRRQEWDHLCNGGRRWSVLEAMRFDVFLLRAIPALGSLLLGAGGLACAEAYDFSAVQEYLDANLHRLDGGVAVIVKRDEAVIFERYEGLGPDSARPVASATKWFAGTVMLILAEQGVFDLDDRISDYVDEFAAPADPLLKELSLRQGFSMSTGMYPSRTQDNGYHRDPRYDLDASLGLIAQNVGVEYGPPGTQIAYYGGGMQAAAAAAVRITGRSWESLCRESLFDPLGLENTHTLAFAPNPAVAGGLVTTPREYMRFLDMLAAQGVVDGQVILGSASIGEMWQRQSGEAPVRETPWPFNHPRYLYGMETPRYSFGAWIMAEDPDTGFIEEISSPGAFGTCPWIDRKRGLQGIIFLDLPIGNDVNWDFQLEVMARIREAVDAADGRCRQLSPEGENWIDPEILSGANWATWQDGALNGWASPVDPEDGSLLDPQIFNTGLAPLVTTINAPEFGLDAAGWSLIYTKSVDGVNQLWRSVRQGEDWSHTALTSGPVPRGGPIISRDTSLPYTWIAYIRGTVQNGDIYCLREDEPENERFVTPFVRGLTNGAWVPGAAQLIYTDGSGALLWMDVETAERVLVSEADLYTSPAPIWAEEEGRLIVAAIAEESSIKIFAETGAGPSGWEEQKEIPLPLGATQLGYTRYESLEPFSFQGRTYFVCHVEKPGEMGTYGEAQIWLMGLEGIGRDRVWRRLDSGADGVTRTEAEWFTSDDEAFVYHTVIDGGTQEIWVAAAGLGGWAELPQRPVLHAGPGGLILSWDGSAQLLESTDLEEWKPVASWNSVWTLPFLPSGSLFYAWEPSPASP